MTTRSCSFKKDYRLDAEPASDREYVYQCKEEALPGRETCLLHTPRIDKHPALQQEKVDLIAAKIRNAADKPLELVGVEIDGDLDLTCGDNIFTQTVRIIDCRIGAIQGRSIKFQAGLYLNHTQVAGDIVFPGIQVTGQASFRQGRVDGDANFQGSQIGGDANFQKSHISGKVDFQESEIGGDTNFGESKIKQDADFIKSQIGGDANFQESQIGGDTSFQGCQINGKADFRKSQIDRDVDFIKSSIGGDTVFEQSQIDGGAYFEQSKIDGDANFWGSRISGNTNFQQSEIGGIANFQESQLGEKANFRESRIDGNADFQESWIDGNADFVKSQIGGTLDFVKSQIGGDALFQESQIGKRADFQKSRIDGDVGFVKSRIGENVNFQASQIAGAMSLSQAEIGGECVMDQSYLLGRLNLHGISCTVMRLNETVTPKINLANHRIRQHLVARKVLWQKTHIRGGEPEARLDISDSCLPVLDCKGTLSSQLYLKNIGVEVSGFLERWQKELEAVFETVLQERLQRLIEFRYRYQSRPGSQQDRDVYGQLYRVFIESAARFLAAFPVDKDGGFPTPDIHGYITFGLDRKPQSDFRYNAKWLAWETTGLLFANYARIKAEKKRSEKEALDAISLKSQPEPHWNFTAQDLKNVSFIGCDLRYVDFLSSRIDDAYFDGCRFFVKRGGPMYGHDKIIEAAKQLAEGNTAEAGLTDRSQNLSDMYLRFKRYFDEAHNYPLAGEFHKQELLLRLQRIGLNIKRAGQESNWKAFRLRLTVSPEQAMLCLYKYACDFGLSWVRAFLAMWVWFGLFGFVLWMITVGLRGDSLDARCWDKTGMVEQGVCLLGEAWELGYRPLLNTFLPRSLSLGMGIQTEPGALARSGGCQAVCCSCMGQAEQRRPKQAAHGEAGTPDGQETSSQAAHSEADDAPGGQERSRLEAAIMFVHFIGISGLFTLFILCLRRRFKR